MKIAVWLMHLRRSINRRKCSKRYVHDYVLVICSAPRSAFSLGIEFSPSFIFLL